MTIAVVVGALLATCDAAWAAEKAALKGGLVVTPLPNLLSPIKALEKLFIKFAGKDKKLTLEEAIKLFNSEDFKALAIKSGLEDAANGWKAEEVTRIFRKADIQHDGHLSKLEFLGLWLGKVASEYGHHPHMIAEALLGIIDRDHDGKISLKEVAGLLKLIGAPSIALMVIPDNIVLVEYRDVLQQLKGSGSGKKGKK
jgi:hypothetical protein